jgi:hypothetical protein
MCNKSGAIDLNGCQNWIGPPLVRLRRSTFGIVYKVHFWKVLRWELMRIPGKEEIFPKTDSLVDEGLSIGRKFEFAS